MRDMKVGDFLKEERDEQAKWIKDSIVQQVQDDMSRRSAVGFVKYGTTMDRKDKSMRDWIYEAYCEALDLSIYLKKIMNEMDSK
jgi:hypothetical protein